MGAVLHVVNQLDLFGTNFRLHVQNVNVDNILSELFRGVSPSLHDNVLCGMQFCGDILTFCLPRSVFLEGSGSGEFTVIHLGELPRLMSSLSGHF